MALENPFQDPLRFETRMPECAIVIFGASGDLTKRKLMPALYRLAYDRRLAAGFAVIGVSRTPLGDDGFREKMREAVRSFSEDTTFDEDVWKAFARGLFYVAGDAGDAALFGRLAQKLAEIEQARHTGGNALFYLSLQPSQYAPAARGWRKAMAGGGLWWKSPSDTIWPARASSAARSTRCSTNPTCTASITTWARRPCRIFWQCDSATGFSSPCGTGVT